MHFFSFQLDGKSKPLTPWALKHAWKYQNCKTKYYSSLNGINYPIFFITRNYCYFDWEFQLKNPPKWFFLPLVQLDQNAVLDKSFWTRPFWLGLFGWFFYWVFLLGFWTRFFLLNHCDNNIIWAMTKKYLFKKLKLIQKY